MTLVKCNDCKYQTEYEADIIEHCKTLNHTWSDYDEYEKIRLSTLEKYALNELKAYFVDSISHIDAILNLQDVPMNLDFLIRDHAVDSWNRNLIIAKHMRTLGNMLDAIRDE